MATIQKTTNKKNSTYVQFSKKMVVFVNVAVTVITLLAMIFCMFTESMTVVQHIVESYIGFATICFAAYSGNSAVEKWLIRKYSLPNSEDDTEEESEDSVG